MKRNVLLLISAIIGTIYGIYLIAYFTGAVSGSSGTEQAGAALAGVLVMPHMAMVWIALIFNWLGYIFKLRWAALVAGILYAVSMVLFFVYFMFVVVEMILCFIAYAKMKKVE
ncbi:MAG: hypothetical protein Q4D13_05605 [Erysipelotrichaceae bacterium]|nr:hypothetical protein [Erysipelotrichaceae bacterium]